MNTTISDIVDIYYQDLRANYPDAAEETKSNVSIEEEYAPYTQEEATQTTKDKSDWTLDVFDIARSIINEESGSFEDTTFPIELIETAPEPTEFRYKGGHHHHHEEPREEEEEDWYPEERVEKNRTVDSWEL